MVEIRSKLPGLLLVCYSMWQYLQNLHRSEISIYLKCGPC